MRGRSTTLLLERHEVEPLLDLRTAIDVVEAACAERGRGQAKSHPPTMFRTPRGFFRVVIGALLDSQRLGVRLGGAAGFSGGGATFAALFDSETAHCLALMSYPFGTVRTGATVALATRLLARPDAQIVGLLGTGRNAMALLEGTMCVRSVREVKVYSPNHRDEFVQRAGPTLGVDVRACAGPGEVVRGSNILLIATSSREPVFDPRDIEPGLYIGSMGQPSELDLAVYRRADLIVIGDKEQEMEARSANMQPLHEIRAESAEAWDRIPELGDIVATGGGRRSAGDVTVFRESQGGWGDVAITNWVYAQARERGLGREIKL